MPNGILSDHDDKGSSSRLVSILAAIFTFLWLSYSVYKNGGVNGIDWQGPMAFMGSGQLPYALSKVVMKWSEMSLAASAAKGPADNLKQLLDVVKQSGSGQ